MTLATKVRATYPPETHPDLYTHRTVRRAVRISL